MLRKKGKVHRQKRKKGFKFLKPLIFLVFLLSLFIYTYNFSVVAQETELKEVTKTDNKELSDLEEKIFHQNFNTEQADSRLSRLENFLFGKAFEKEVYETRINKITAALKTPEKEKPAIEEIKPESIETPSTPQAITNKEGIIGAINQIEMKMFNMTYNDYPFPARISSLEDRLLSKSEISINRSKPLLERVTILVSKAGILQDSTTMTQTPTSIQKPTANNGPKSYSIDPKTGLLINEQTGETVKDSDGNPISVMLPQPLPQQNYGGYLPQQNPLLQNSPYGNQFQQNPGGIPSPYDFLFNQQNNLDPGGSDPGY